MKAAQRFRTLAVAAVAACSGAAALTLDGTEYWVVSGAEGSAVTAAVRDVKRDAYKTLGFEPYVAASPPAPGSLPEGTTVLYLGTAAAAPWLNNFTLPAGCTSDWEAHCVVAVPGSAPGSSGYTSIVATGAGVRGAIYGAYSFSEEVLGVNPWALFTDDPPAFAGPVAVNDSLVISYPSPKWRMRGWFINDEDLLSNLHPDQLGRACMDSRSYEELIETLLRNKCNLLLPATNPLPDEDVYSIAAARGLIVTHHHYDLLGSPVFSWPLPSSDWDWQKDPGTMAALWRASIAAQQDLPEVLWSIGLRGLNDYSYPCSGAAECGRLISEAMGNQSAWVRAVQPNATLITYLWDEALELLTSGDLIIPEGTKILFTDAGAGIIRVDSNFSRYANGIYTHTAMYNSAANQLSEMVPADRIFAQMGAATKGANTTDILIDNVSDLRPAVMTTDALFRFAWNPEAYMVQDPNTTALQHYARWGAAQHHIPGGATAPAAVAFAQLWFDFFLVPYVQAGNSDNFLSNAVIDIATAAAPTIRDTGSVAASVVSSAQ